VVPPFVYFRARYSRERWVEDLALPVFGRPRLFVAFSVAFIVAGFIVAFSLRISVAGG